MSKALTPCTSGASEVTASSLALVPTNRFRILQFHTSSLPLSAKQVLGARNLAKLDPNCELFIALTIDREFAGMVQVAPYSVHPQTRAEVGFVPEIQRLFSVSGNGIGSWLLREAEQYAVSVLNASAIVLHAPSYDERLCDFYRKQGFSSSGGNLVSLRSGRPTVVTPFVKRLSAENFKNSRNIA